MSKKASVIRVDRKGRPIVPTRMFHHTKYGKVFHGEAIRTLREYVKPKTVDLIITSPPFGLVRKKDYDNVDAEDYVRWFKQFGKAFKRTLKPSGSLVIEIGGAWIRGQPSRSLYHFELLIMLCRECGFHLAQEFFWWNPAKLPTPAEWVTIRRVRVRDGVTCIWWLSPTPWPKANNRRVLVPYSDSMRSVLEYGASTGERPSGHKITKSVWKDNKGAIPSNFIAVAHTDSQSSYFRYCKKMDIKPHSARFHPHLPEYFIRMLTDPNDLVVDPFAGSCTTGEVADRLRRRWICVELEKEYLRGAMGRLSKYSTSGKMKVTSYSVPSPSELWTDKDQPLLSLDGGRIRK